jgi:hypothetical protein
LFLASRAVLHCASIAALHVLSVGIMRVEFYAA